METTVNVPAAKSGCMFRSFWGAYEGAVNEWVLKAEKLSYVKRIWDGDASLWTKDVKVQKEIKNRLGWLTVAKLMKEKLGELSSFADEIKSEGFTRVVLLGMGGSSLTSEVFQTTFGNKAGYPELTILDSTDPERIRDVEARLDLAKTLFIVSSKSGGTIELTSLFKYFYGRVKSVSGENAGRQFIAITDPGSPLTETAAGHGFRKIFLGPENVGGRFSALTYFGLVPASLIGADVVGILKSVESMMDNTYFSAPVADNPAVALGVGMAVLSEQGRDKLTILAPKQLESFGDWVEQLVAESVGKEGVGILPIVREPMDSLEVYGEDRFFVGLTLESEKDAALDARLAELQKAGHPVLILKIKSLADLGGQFFLWEMATAVACVLLKINAFDQPDVQAAKDSAKAILKKVESGGEVTVLWSKFSLESFWAELDPGDYIGILAFIPDREELKSKLIQLQSELRRRTQKAVTLGIGPRYLHSTGQLHKGGPSTGVFLLITTLHDQDLPVPGEKFTFSQLELAQAMGDFEALDSRGQRVFHFRLDSLSEKNLDAVADQVLGSLPK